MLALGDCARRASVPDNALRAHVLAAIERYCGGEVNETDVEVVIAAYERERVKMVAMKARAGG